MTIKDLRKLPGTSTWMWRTVESDTGDYYTFANAQGILFYHDTMHRKIKCCTMERFHACKTVEETEQKLNQIFANIERDPIPGVEKDLWLKIPMEKKQPRKVTE